MPVQRIQSSLLSKLGDKLKKAAEAHKSDPTEYGNIELPAGINNGIAQLVDCKFMQIAEGKQGAGEYMLYAAGIVKVPTDHGGVPTQGLRTMISEVIYDTPTRARKTVEEHVEFVQNEMKKLLGKGFDPDLLSGDNLESTAAMLKEAAPHFRFRTWKGSKQVVGKGSDGKWRVYDEDEKGNKVVNKRATGTWSTEEAAKKANPYADGREPRVNHDWQGSVAYEGDGTEGAVTDETSSSSGTPSSNGEARASVGTSSLPQTDNEEEVDMTALVALADDGDQEAMEKLQTMAQEAGVAPNDVEKAQNWTEVSELIVAHQGGTTPSEPAATPNKPWEPDKGELYSYRPVDTKGKKGKPVEVEVMSVDKKTKTVTIKDNATKKLIPDPKNAKVGRKVAWDNLENA